jgi:release factor glutamine methyltransferase
MAIQESPVPQRTLGEIIDAGAAWLRVRHVDEPRQQCLWLAGSLLSLTRTDLLAALKNPVGDEVVDRLRKGVVRLGTGEPVQYVVGEWDFRFITLRTDARGLIPRPETEELVQLALDEPELWEIPSPAVCDVGTGTGCIAISFAVERPQCRVAAVDCEMAALSLARENAARCGVADRIRFVQGRGCANAEAGSLDAVVSNPPYIPAAVVDSLPKKIRDFEPRTALDGGADGLEIVRDVIRDSAIALRKGGWLFLEIGDDQGEAVRAAMEDAGFDPVEIFRDFAGKTRYVKGRII